MARIPRDERLDSTLDLLRDGYAFISRRCARLDTDVFETRLLLQRAICVRGEDAARMFYHPDRFTRTGGMPLTTLMLLQDKGSVQTLSGPAHRHRKALFLHIMTPDRTESLIQAVCEQWQARMRTWERAKSVVLLDELLSVFCRAALRWAGLPFGATDAQRRTAELAAMVDGAGAFGPRNWWALALRVRAERWARSVIREARQGLRKPPGGSALHAIVNHVTDDGELLDVNVAAVELLNVLRPIVAVARYAVFAADALHACPEWTDAVADHDGYLTAFVQEIRRYYPFFPVVGGRAREAFEWRGYHISEGAWVLLDLYGTNHDERLWEQPHVFRPERFLGHESTGFDLVPQGAGDLHTTHRCPGEQTTIELLKATVLLLATTMDYEVPQQDLRIDLSRVPARPNSGFVIQDVRPLEEAPHVEREWPALEPGAPLH